VVTDTLGGCCFAQEIGAAVGKAANVEVRDGKLVEAHLTQRRYALEQNRHQELEWGPSVGNEVWIIARMAAIWSGSMSILVSFAVVTAE
jgi:antitoxin MazE